METLFSKVILTGDTVRVVKGCRARNISKGTRAKVTNIRELGPQYSHAVAVNLDLNGRMVTFYARHMNRLNDGITRLNDGNPLHVIEIQRVR